MIDAMPYPAVTTLPFAVRRTDDHVILTNVSNAPLLTTQLTITRGIAYDTQVIGCVAPRVSITVPISRYLTFPNSRICVQWRRSSDNAMFVWSTTTH